MEYIILQENFKGITTIAPKLGGKVIDVKIKDLENYEIIK